MAARPRRLAAGGNSCGAADAGGGGGDWNGVVTRLAAVGVCGGGRRTGRLRRRRRADFRLEATGPVPVLPGAAAEMGPVTAQLRRSGRLGKMPTYRPLATAPPRHLAADGNVGRSGDAGGGGGDGSSDSRRLARTRALFSRTASPYALPNRRPRVAERSWFDGLCSPMAERNNAPTERAR